MHPSTVGETNEYKYDPTAPDSKMQYIWDPKAIHTKVALQMRGMDVLIADPASAQWRDTVPTVFMLTNGGTILEIKPALLEDTANLLLLYDASDGSSSKPSLDQFTPGPYAVRVGLLRTDGTTKDLTNDWKAVEGVMRDADYTGGLVVVADFDGDTYPDVLSGRHISYNKPAAGTQGHAGTHPGQRGIYDQLPKEWWTFGVTPSAVEALDADGDGDVDLVIMPRGFDETGVPTTAGGGSIKPVLQLLLNDGSGDFSRAERRVVVDASFSIAGFVQPNELTFSVAQVAGTTAITATKIVAGQLNTVDDARDDFVVIWPSGGATRLCLRLRAAATSRRGTVRHCRAAHGRAVTASKIIDVAVASLTGVAAADTTKRPQQDVLLLDDTNNVHLIPGTSLAQLGSTIAAGITGDATAQAGTVSVAVTPSAGTLKKLEVGYVLRNGPSGASSGFLRNDGVGGSGLPLRKSSTPGAILDSDGTPTDTDADTGDTLKQAILGQTDNAGVIRDELEPELRTPDIVLAGTDEVWMLSPVSLIRDVSERYGASRRKGSSSILGAAHAHERPDPRQRPQRAGRRDPQL